MVLLERKPQAGFGSGFLRSDHACQEASKLNTRSQRPPRSRLQAGSQVPSCRCHGCEVNPAAILWQWEQGIQPSTWRVQG